MNRLVLALVPLAVLATAQPVLAQPNDWYDARREAREARRQAREEAREAREEAREAAREAREEAREAWQDTGRGSDGVHLRIFRSYDLPEGVVSREPIVVVGGSATINGRVEDDVVVIGGTLRVGPKAEILGEAVTVGGSAIIDPAARIAKGVDETAIDWPDLDFGWGTVSDGWWRVASLGTTIARLGFILMLSLFITWLTPGFTGRVGARVSESPLGSLVTGFMAQILFVPAMVLIVILLTVTIIGIPLLLALPFVWAGMCLLWAAGFAGVTGRLGARLRGQAPGQSTSPTLDLLTGFAAVVAFTVLGRFLAIGSAWMGPSAFVAGGVGVVLEYVVWTLGLGAALMAFGRRATAPPPLPFVPTPAPSEM